MRVFVAVKLDEDIKRGIAKISDKIEKTCLGGRYTDPINYHITLEFIGEIEPNRLVDIKKAMDDVAEKCQPFDVKIEGIGRFEKGSSAIVWIGASLGRFGLFELNNKLLRHLEELGIDTGKKKFNPHITVGRKVILSDSFENLESGKFIQKVDRIVLMESARKNGKLLYTQIYESGFSQ